MTFTPEQLDRYSRNIMLPEVGEQGQRTLLDGSVVIVGAGGLGSPAALYLAGVGVGTIGLVDDDVVALNNLQRQVVHSTETIGTAKVASAARRLHGLNPDIAVRTHEARLSARNAAGIIGDYDFVIEATDSLESKCLVSEACVSTGKPHCHGGVVGLEGQALTVLPGRTACYRCVFPELPPPGALPRASETGVLGPVPGVIGTVQAAEAIKFLLGIGELLENRLLIYDSLRTRFRHVAVKPDTDCPLCSGCRIAAQTSDEQRSRRSKKGHDR